MKNLPALEETLARPLGWKDPPDMEDMATHSSILAWKTPQRSLVGDSPWGRKESDTERLTLTELKPQQMEDVSILHSREVRVQSEGRPVVSDSLRPRRESPGQNIGVGSLSLLQGIFPTQGSNPGLPHCRRILYQLSHREAQEYWGEQPVPSPAETQESNRGLLHCRQILPQLNYHSRERSQFKNLFIKRPPEARVTECKL